MAIVRYYEVFCLRILLAIGMVLLVVPEVAALVALDREVAVVLWVDGHFIGGCWMAFLFLHFGMTT